MRRVYGTKVTRITRGGLLSCTERNLGAGGLKSQPPHVRQKSAEVIVVVLTKR